MLDKYDKQFIIIGNTNALTYKTTFRMFKQDRIRTGYTHFNTGMFFLVPDSFEKYHHIEEGKKIARVSTSCWYTNLPVDKHKEPLILYKHYTPEEYPIYDNYNAIEVSTYTNIPCDYDGEIGVPITFLDKYNPEQFEIIGSFNASSLESKKEDDYVLSTDTLIVSKGKESYWNGPVVNKCPLYKRIVIKKRNNHGD